VGPGVHGGEKAGRYEYEIDVSPTTGRTDPVQNKDGTWTATAKVTGVKITITDKYTVPDWQNKNDENVSEQDRQEWNAESGRLDQHEIAHGGVTTQGVKELLKPALEKLAPAQGTGTGKTKQEAKDNATQNAIDNSIQPVIDTINAEIRKRQIEFDRLHPNSRSN
jgi:predicted secreted Zn-dependent protease